jgi:hypothetical protein
VTPRDPACVDEILHLVRYGGLQVVCAIAGLSYRRGVDVDLNFGLALGEDIGLEVRRNLNDKKQLALVHFRVDIGRPYLSEPPNNGPRA